jgi:hypothetical protein
MCVWHRILVALLISSLAEGMLDVRSMLSRMFQSARRSMTSSTHAAPSSSSSSSSSADESKGATRTARRVGGTVLPPVLLFLAAVSSVDASPLNPQPIALFGPFFQGWLVRTVDHSCQRSVILIVGSFSKGGSRRFNEHYVFCGVETPDGAQQFEAFPDPSGVSITGTRPSLPFPARWSPFAQKTNITWAAKNLGWFKFNDDECCADFKLGGARIRFTAKNRLPWCRINTHSEGPEGKLAYVPFLLPCHYFVHSCGSDCDYSLDLPTARRSESSVRSLLTSTHTLSGRGHAHIEGNHGTCFPRGWVWAQGVSRDNLASFSLTGGRFEIGPLSPLNFILFVRSDGGRTRIFRTTDLDKVEYDLDGVSGTVRLTATSVFGQSKAVLTITPKGPFESAFGKPIHIPTPAGFSDTPGCRETYTATADIACFDYDVEAGEYRPAEAVRFPLTALEFGGNFQGVRQLSRAKRREVIRSLGLDSSKGGLFGL